MNIPLWPFAINFYAVRNINYDKNLKSKFYQCNWLIMTLSLTDIIHFHIISVEMTEIFIILTCFILGERR